MYIPILGYLLFNRVCAGIPNKIIEDVLINSIMYIGWNIVKITYNGITYTLHTAYNYNITTPLITYIPTISDIQNDIKTMDTSSIEVMKDSNDCVV